MSGKANAAQVSAAQPSTVSSSGPAIINFGCRLNIAEGAAIRTQLAGHGHADGLTVINSCAVTASAVRDARSAVRRAHRANPDGRIIVTGCAAQIEPATFAAMPEVHRVIGNGEKFERAAYNDDAASARIQVRDAARLTALAPQLLPSYDGHARAFLEVQNGCDHSCTFCVIPQGRGPSRSVPMAQVSETIRQLVQNGTQEVVLTGVDLTSYDAGGRNLSALIIDIFRHVPALQRLRLGSIDVAEIDADMIALFADEPRLLPHVHLSLQHGDNLILKRMKRRHSREQAIAAVARLKDARPDISIGSDIIAGFPTEDDAAFAQCLSLIDACHIVHPHIFPYSPRANTPAARMPQIARPIVKQRAAALRTHAMARRSEWLRSLVGTAQAMLVELDGISGHLDNFAPVRLTHVAPANRMTTIRITGLDGGTLIGNVEP